MKTKIFLFVFFYFINNYAQEFGMGLLLDDSLYANSPTAAPLMRGDYEDLPISASLKKNAPTPGNQGAAKLNDFGYDCDREVTALDKVKAVNYRIIEYREVASARTEEKTKFVKKSIAEGRPVVIAIDCPPSFSYAGEFWNPKEDEYKNWGRGHGITVVGYDENKFGGAFELINSWGTYW